jgi:hypothetical protein
MVTVNVRTRVPKLLTHWNLIGRNVTAQPVLSPSSILPPKYENGEWKSRTNRELEETSKGENIVKWINGPRISWLGHLERMGEDRMPKKIFTQELEGTRRRGRPRKGWREETERDLQVLGVKRWREVVIIHIVVCLTTGSKPLPKRALHIVLSRASSFK